MIQPILTDELADFGIQIAPVDHGRVLLAGTDVAFYGASLIPAPAIDNGQQVIDLVVARKRFQNAQGTGIVIHGTIGNGGIVILVRPQQGDGAFVVPVPDGLYALHIGSVQDGCVNGILEHRTVRNRG